jgi:predicted LPLAT superfamily acyltransferase
MQINMAGLERRANGKRERFVATVTLAVAGPPRLAAQLANPVSFETSRADRTRRPPLRFEKLSRALQISETRRAPRVHSHHRTNTNKVFKVTR